MKDGGGILAGGGTIGSGKASLEDAGGAVAGGGAEGTDDAGGDGGGDGVTEGGTNGAQDDLATAPAGTVAAITVTAADDTTLVAANTTTAADDATLIAAVAAVLPKRSTPRAGGDTDGLSIQRRTTPPDPGDSGTRAVPDSPVQVNSMRCEWEYFDAEAVERSPDGRSVTARFDLTQAVALGSPESQPSTVTTWNIRIDESRLNQGGAMCIGVCDVRAPLPSLPAPAPARLAAHRHSTRAGGGAFEGWADPRERRRIQSLLRRAAPLGRRQRRPVLGDGRPEAHARRSAGARQRHGGADEAQRAPGHAEL